MAAADQNALEQAVRQAIATEKGAHDFYRACAVEMRDAEARRVFELLCREEAEHAASFYAVYTGSDIPDLEAYIEGPAEPDSTWIADLKRCQQAGFNDRRAMALALKKEQALEAQLRQQAAAVADAGVRKIFEANASSTHHHYELIESEYARLMGMVHESDIDTYVRE